jgi:hypothetical protein
MLDLDAPFTGLCGFGVLEQTTSEGGALACREEPLRSAGGEGAVSELAAIPTADPNTTCRLSMPSRISICAYI